MAKESKSKKLNIQGIAMATVGVTAGAIGAGLAVKAAKKVLGDKADEWAFVVPAVVGVALPLISTKVLKLNNPIINNVGLGMLAVSGVMAYNKFTNGSIISVQIAGVADEMNNNILGIGRGNDLDLTDRALNGGSIGSPNELKHLVM